MCGTTSSSSSATGHNGVEVTGCARSPPPMLLSIIAIKACGKKGSPKSVSISDLCTQTRDSEIAMAGVENKVLKSQQNMRMCTGPGCSQVPRLKHDV